MTKVFDSFDAFLAMGKHGVYVWSAWAVVSLVLLLVVYLSRQARHQTQRDIALQIKRRQQAQRKINTTNGNL